MNCERKFFVLLLTVLLSIVFILPSAALAVENSPEPSVGANVLENPGTQLIVPMQIQTFEVGTKEELDNAINTINDPATVGNEFTISLTADIAYDYGATFRFNREGTTTTILGNGHTLSDLQYIDVQKGAVLHLGSATDSGNTLTIDGTYTREHYTAHCLFYLDGQDSQLFMHEGTTVENRKVSQTNQPATVVWIQAGTTFNMLGGTIQNCEVADAGLVSGSWQAMITVWGGTFNMSGGTIQNNTVTRQQPPTSRDFIVPGAAVLVMEGEVNITGGSITGNVLNSGENYGFGAGILATDNASKVSIKNATISNNTVQGKNSFGGGIMAWNGAEVTIENTTIANNTVSGASDGMSYGGGIMALEANPVVVTGSVITGNKAEGGDSRGGGIFASETTVTLTDSFIALNTAETAAPDVYFESTGGHTLTLPPPKSIIDNQPESIPHKIEDWYVDVAGDRWSPENQTDWFDATEPITVTSGQFELIVAYSDIMDITFDLNGGTLDGQTGSITINDKYGNTIVMPSAPTREGYDFICWQDKDDAQAQYQPGDDFLVNGDHTFTAIWGAEIIFDLNGGTLNGQIGSITMNVKCGDTIEMLPAPTRNGFTFVHWQGSFYNPGDLYTVVEGHTFTAIWEATPEPTEPTESSESTEPTGPTESSESTEPTGPTEPSQSTEPTGQTEPSQSTEPTGQTEPSQSTEPTETTEISESTAPPEFTGPSEQTEPTGPTESSPSESTTAPTERTEKTNPASQTTSTRPSGTTPSTGEQGSTAALRLSILLLVLGSVLLIAVKKMTQDIQRRNR